MIRLLVNPAFWVITLMHFVWVETVRIGGFSVNLPYFAALALITAMAVTPAFYRGLTALVKYEGIWLLAYALYLPLLFLALLGSEAASMALRQAFFATSALAFAAWVATNSGRGNLLRAAALAGLLLTFVAIELLAREVGLSWLNAILSFFRSGDLNFIIYGFFRQVFNVAAGEGSAPVGAAAKNALAASLFTAGVMFRAAHQTEDRDGKGMIVSALVLVVLVMLNTRSVLLVALLAFPLVGIISLTRRGRISLARSVGSLIALSAGVTALVLIVNSDTAVVSTLAERLSFTDASAGSRFDQIRWALERIEGAVWSGSGYAEIDGHPVHNLFLGAWMHAGVLAFVLVTVFYIGLFATWVRFITGILVDPAFWILPLRAEWVSVLPLVPLFRVWLSGDAGHMNFVEWTAIGAFLGLITANRLTLSTVAGKQGGQLAERNSVRGDR